MSLSQILKIGSKAFTVDFFETKILTVYKIKKIDNELEALSL